MTATEYNTTSDIQRLKIAIALLKEVDHTSMEVSQTIEHLSKYLEEISREDSNKWKVTEIPEFKVAEIQRFEE